MLTTNYRVTLDDTDIWIFKYRISDGNLYEFTNVKGENIIPVIKNNHFPTTKTDFEYWLKDEKIKEHLIIEKL